LDHKHPYEKIHRRRKKTNLQGTKYGDGITKRAVREIQSREGNNSKNFQNLNSVMNSNATKEVKKRQLIYEQIDDEVFELILRLRE
jgi:hypothetical protein